MKFEMPKADRARLEQLLEYLGDRADDFKKCFDVESEWCWKYADLVLMGIEKRELEYAEGHHIVPASFYGKRGCKKVDDCNLTVLTYGEHLWAHYCLCYCATGKMRGKMAKAFLIMYGKGICNIHALMPSETELLDAIPEMEIKRIQAMEPQWAKVEAEGRTHYNEDPKQYMKEYNESNREKILERNRARYKSNWEKFRERNNAWYESNKEKIAERNKARYESNKEKILERKKAYYEANKEKIAEINKAYREANREKIAEINKAYYRANREKCTEYRKAYYEANKENCAKRCKAYREANREKIAEINKAWRDANKENIAEYGKAWRDAKKAAGYRDRKDPVTGKHHWIFVGLPATPETPKSTSGAA